MKKNRLTTRIIATAMAAVCVISAGTAISAMSVSAAEISSTEAIAASSAKACVVSKNHLHL